VQGLRCTDSSNTLTTPARICMAAPSIGHWPKLERCVSPGCHVSPVALGNGCAEQGRRFGAVMQIHASVSVRVLELTLQRNSCLPSLPSRGNLKRGRSPIPTSKLTYCEHTPLPLPKSRTWDKLLCPFSCSPARRAPLQPPAHAAARPSALRPHLPAHRSPTQAPTGAQGARPAQRGWLPQSEAPWTRACCLQQSQACIPHFHACDPTNTWPSQSKGT